MVDFRPPGTSKIELSPKRRAIFHEFTFSAWAPQKPLQNRPKMTPQTSPGGLQRVQNADQKRCSIGAQISSDVLMIFGAKMALKRAQKSLEDEVFRDLGAPGPPEASRKPPGSHFEAFLGDFGTILVPK